MNDMEIEDVQVDQPRQLTDRQLASLISLWRLSHYKQAPWSTWSILYSQRRPRRSRAPMLCFDTPTYKLLKQQQEEDLQKKQMHQHHIWKHVQDRLTEQNEILEQEKVQKSAQGKKSKNQQKRASGVTVSTDMDTSGSSPVLSPTSSSSTVTSDSGSPKNTTPIKRSITWRLQNNTVKRFDKTSPITLVSVPAVDKRPVKSALKVRTSQTIQKTTATKTTTTTTTTTTKSNTNTKNASAAGLARKHAVDFF
ncbi:hypothetical protein BC939DRAFT_461285 [Gamsiella multidivaricata]|uniref:uncharacterized protein n=1 Tax=Gamsiella multidivaricata TaxID=101098 RepID=UPI00221EFC79|nr:uncharacterized protein BC939DRAFT_461285 [Gamsiella multidivaricata]KAG0358765.1 hypothetical protein BGZ54_010298 [Gamsiella multidivaricata]KAI7819000.1 hypothetical protein BC939DRAFT_461285 [Gamsiella multidivaricata]